MSSPTQDQPHQTRPPSNTPTLPEPATTENHPVVAGGRRTTRNSQLGRSQPPPDRRKQAPGTANQSSPPDQLLASVRGDQDAGVSGGGPLSGSTASVNMMHPDVASGREPTPPRAIPSTPVVSGGYASAVRTGRARRARLLDGTATSHNDLLLAEDVEYEYDADGRVVSTLTRNAAESDERRPGSEGIRAAQVNSTHPDANILMQGQPQSPLSEVASTGRQLNQEVRRDDYDLSQVPPRLLQHIWGRFDRQFMRMDELREFGRTDIPDQGISDELICAYVAGNFNENLATGDELRSSNVPEDNLGSRRYSEEGYEDGQTPGIAGSTTWTHALHTEMSEGFLPRRQQLGLGRDEAYWGNYNNSFRNSQPARDVDVPMPARYSDTRSQFVRDPAPHLASSVPTYLKQESASRGLPPVSNTSRSFMSMIQGQRLGASNYQATQPATQSVLNRYSAQRRPADLLPSYVTLGLAFNGSDVQSGYTTAMHEKIAQLIAKATKRTAPAPPAMKTKPENPRKYSGEQDSIEFMSWVQGVIWWFSTV